MLQPNLKSVKDTNVLAYISYLEKRNAELTKFETKSGFATYIAIKNQIDSFNEQITIKTVSLPDPDDATKSIDVESGFISLFADKDSKEFERSFKYMESAFEMVDRQEKLYKLLTEEEKEQVKKFAAGSSAEKHIFGKE